MSEPMQRLRAFWDERYGVDDFVYGRDPNTFLQQWAVGLKPGAAALCLADGEGRNGVWLASQGALVTSVDISDAGLAKARDLALQRGVEIAAVAGDVTAFEIGVESWDLIVSIFLHLPPKSRSQLHRRCLRALKPGGRFIFEAYGGGQLALGTGGPKEAALLPTLDDVQSEVEGEPHVKLLHAHQGRRIVTEGSLHKGEGEVVQLVLEKASSDCSSSWPS